MSSSVAAQARPRVPAQQESGPPLREFMTRREAAAYLSGRGIPCAFSTLNSLAGKGLGPPFIRFHDGGRPRYAREALDLWIEEKKRSGAGA